MQKLNILFQDDHFLVIDKPPGLVVAPTETQSEPTLADIVKSEYGIDLERAGIVHRLDKDTSGIILVAKTQQAFENLQSQFRDRVVHKQYIALVHGKLLEAGKIDAPIARNPENREKFTVVSPNYEGGREAVTEYEPREQLIMDEQKFNEIFAEFNKIQLKKLARIDYKDYSLVLCKPLTGRTHQIRVHLKYIGFPIVADERYVGRKMFRLDYRWCKRQFLHAAKIEFKHPITGETMIFESPLPEDLKNALNILTSNKNG